MYLLRKIEPAITLLLIVFYADFNFPDLVRKFISAIAYIVIFILIIGQRKRFIYVATRDVFLLLLIIAAVISVTWSVAPEKTQVIARSLSLTTLFGVYLATRYTPKELMQLILLVSSISVFLSLIFALTIPSYGTHIVDGVLCWRGVFKHKNYLALMMAVSASLFLINALYSEPKYRGFLLTGTVISLSILLLTRGMSSISLFISSLLLLPIYKILKQYYKLQVFLLTTFVLISSSIVTGILSNLETIVVDIMGKDLGGNGRDVLWSYLLQRGFEKPWLGYGYSGFWYNYDEAFGVAANTWLNALESLGHAHSGFVELFLHLGVLGVSLMVLSFLTTIIRLTALLTLTKQSEFFWMLQFSVLMLFSNFSVSGSFIAARSFYWILYVSIALSSSVYYARIRKTRLIKSTSITPKQLSVNL